MLVRPFHTSFIAEHELGIGNFKFYKNVVIGQVYEGVNVTYENALPLFGLVLDYYSEETPLVYLSDRQNSYSTDPTMYFEVKKIFPNIKGYGMIVYDDLKRRVAALEQKFLEYPTAVFTSRDKALVWAVEQLERTDDTD